MTARHKVPRSTIHLVATKCWMAAGMKTPRYVYLTDLDVECARQNTENMVVYAEPVGSADAGEHFMLVAKFPMRGISGDASLYKAILIMRLNEVWSLARKRGLVP